MRKKEEFSVLKIRLYNDSDYLIQNYLETKSNKSSYIKKLIMKDMMHEKTLEEKIYETLERFFADNVVKTDKTASGIQKEEKVEMDKTAWEKESYEKDKEIPAPEDEENEAEGETKGLSKSALSFLDSLEF